MKKTMEWRLKARKEQHRRAIKFTASIPPCPLLSSRGSSSQRRPTAGNSSFPPTSRRPRSRFPISATSSTRDRKSTATTREFGSGERVGEAERWLSSDRAERAGQPTATAIVSTPLLSTPISWKSTRCLRYANCRLIASFSSSRPSAFLTSSSSPSRLRLTTKRSRPRFSHYWRSRQSPELSLTVPSRLS